MKKTLVVAVACAFALGTAALLPADLSPIGSAYAQGNGGGHGGGNGGGNGGGHGGGNGGGNGSGASHGDGDGNGHGNGQGKGALGHTSDPSDASSGVHGAKRNGKVEGVEHAGKSTRDHGVSGKHNGTAKNDSNGHGQATSAVAHSKDTQGRTKSAAISATKPAHKNTKQDN